MMIKYLFSEQEFKDFWECPGRGIALFIIVTYALVSFLIGTATHTVRANQNLVPASCEAETIQQLVNIPWRLGCEFTKPRWAK